MVGLDTTNNYGDQRGVELYVTDGNTQQRLTSWSRIEMQRGRNELDKVKFDIFANDTVQDLLERGNHIFIFKGEDTLRFKGRIEEVNAQTSGKFSIRAAGMENKLYNKKLERNQIEDKRANNILTDDILDGELTLGTVEQAPETAIRFDHDNKLRALSALANNVDFDWVIDQDGSDGWGENTISFVEDVGETISGIIDDFENLDIQPWSHNQYFDIVSQNAISGIGSGRLLINSFDFPNYSVDQSSLQSSPSLSSVDPESITFADDGSKAYIVDGYNIHQFNLSDPYDPSTYYAEKIVDISGDVTAPPKNVEIVDGGSKMMFCAGGNNDLFPDDEKDMLSGDTSLKFSNNNEAVSITSPPIRSSHETSDNAVQSLSVRIMMLDAMFDTDSFTIDVLNENNNSIGTLSVQYNSDQGGHFLYWDGIAFEGVQVFDQVKITFDFDYQNDEVTITTDVENNYAPPDTTTLPTNTYSDITAVKFGEDSVDSGNTLEFLIDDIVVNGNTVPNIKTEDFESSPHYFTESVSGDADDVKIQSSTVLDGNQSLALRSYSVDGSVNKAAESFGKSEIIDGTTVSFLLNNPVPEADANLLLSTEDTDNSDYNRNLHSGIRVGIDNSEAPDGNGQAYIYSVNDEDPSYTSSAVEYADISTVTAGDTYEFEITFYPSEHRAKCVLKDSSGSEIDSSNILFSGRGYFVSQTLYAIDGRSSSNRDPGDYVYYDNIDHIQYAEGFESGLIDLDSSSWTGDTDNTSYVSQGAYVFTYDLQTTYDITSLSLNGSKDLYNGVGDQNDENIMPGLITIADGGAKLYHVRNDFYNNKDVSYNSRVDAFDFTAGNYDISGLSYASETYERGSFISGIDMMYNGLRLHLIEGSISKGVVTGYDVVDHELSNFFDISQNISENTTYGLGNRIRNGYYFENENSNYHLSTLGGVETYSTGTGPKTGYGEIDDFSTSESINFKIRVDVPGDFEGEHTLVRLLSESGNSRSLIGNLYFTRDNFGSDAEIYWGRDSDGGVMGVGSLGVSDLSTGQKSWTYIQDYTPGYFVTTPEGVTIEPGEVHDISISLDAGNDEVTITIDGTEYGPFDTASDFTSDFDSADVFRFETISAGSTNKAFIDDVAVGPTFRVNGELLDVEDISEDRESYNSVTYLGYGDGENQIEASVWDAGPHTLLSEKISEGYTGSISVENGSVLGSDGDTITVRLGEEVVDGTLSIDQNSSTDSISVSDRGLDDYNGNPTEDRKHYAGIGVWLVENATSGDGPYTPDNPWQYSSIGREGDVIEARESDTSVVNEASLEKAASDAVLSNRDEIRRIRVEFEDEYRSDIDIGDSIRVADSTIDFDGVFEVQHLESKYGSGQSYAAELSREKMRLTDKLEEVRRDTDSLESHMQGSTNIDTQNVKSDAGSNAPVETKIRIPEDAIRINTIELSLSRDPFRGLVSDSSQTGEYLNQYYVWYDPGETADASNDNVFASVDVVDSPAESFEGANISYQILNKTLNQQDYDYKIRNDTTSTTLESGTFSNIDSFSSIIGNYSASSSEVSPGDKIVFKITSGVVGTDDVSGRLGGYGIVANSKSSHSHELDFFDGSESTVDVDIYIDGDNTPDITINDLDVNQSTTTFDISDYLSEPIRGEYHDIKILPSGDCNINATIFAKFFVESTV